eukprot:Pgem_evm1s15104
MATSKQVNTDWTKRVEIGDFKCSSCRLTGLPPSAFSSNQLQKARKSPDLKAKCKKCCEAEVANKPTPAAVVDGYL